MTFRIIILLGVLSAGVFGSVEWTKLHAKYAFWDGFFELPLKLNDIGEAEDTSGKGPEYVLLEKDPELNVDVYSHPQDPRVCLLFDSYGNIAGIRMSYIKDDIKKRAEEHHRNFTYDYSRISMFKDNIYLGKQLWNADVLFVKPEKLELGGRSDTHGIVAEGIYVKLEGKWMEVPKNECLAETKGFVKQNCYIGMGNHYFYKTDKDLKCENFEPFFALYSNTELIGFGVTPFGSFTSKDGGREWFEDVPTSVAKKIIPNRPDCMVDWMDNFGATSLHVFLTKHPRLTICRIPLIGRWFQKEC